MFFFGCALICVMTIALFADPPLRRRAVARMRKVHSPRHASTDDRGWVVVEILVVLLIASIALATIVLVIGGLANTRL